MDKIPPKTTHSVTTSESEEKTDEKVIGKYQQKEVAELSPKLQEYSSLETENKPLAQAKVSTVTHQASDEESGEVKDKPEAAKVAPSNIREESRVDPETLKQVFWDLSWPDNPANESYAEDVVRNINKAINALPLETAIPKKANAYFQKAVIFRRCGKLRQAQIALGIAIQLDPRTVIEQLELSKALLYFEKPLKDYAEALIQYAILKEHSNNYSLLAQLKIAEIAAGLYPDFKLPISPVQLPKLMSSLIVDLTKGKTFPEALYTNDLELAYLVPYPLFVIEGSSANDRLTGNQWLWSTMDAFSRSKKMELPGCHKKDGVEVGMGADLYDCCGRTLMVLGLGDSRPLRDSVSKAILTKLRSRLLSLKRIKFSNPITYTDAIAALLLGLAHQKKLLEEPSNKAAADYFLQAAGHPAFKELLANAASQYEKVMCFREAAYCQNVLAEHLEVFYEDAENLRECAVDNLKRAEEYDLFVKEVELLSLDPKTKKKRKRKKTQDAAGSDSSSASSAINPEDPSEEKVSPQPSPIPVVEKTEKNLLKTSVIDPASAPLIGEYHQWDLNVKKFLRDIYLTRRAEDFVRQKEGFNQAKAKAPAVPESCEIFMESAWYHLHQIDLTKPDRVTLNDKGEPAEIEELCRQARIDLATAFRRLTGLKITHSINPETMKNLLQKHFPCQIPVKEHEKRFRHCLRKIMSSFGHSYSYMADLAPENRQLGSHAREFYKLKKIANPEYSKPGSITPGQEGKVRLVSRKDFDQMQKALKS